MLALRDWEQQRYLYAGRAIYDVLAPAQRVAWAASLLRFCAAQCPPVQVIDDVLALVDSPPQWTRAHKAFQNVRDLTLAVDQAPQAFDRRLGSLLDVTENTAKVIYNASGSPAPFDYDAGWRLGPCLQRFLFDVNDAASTAEGMELFFAPVDGSAA